MNAIPKVVFLGGLIAAFIVALTGALFWMFSGDEGARAAGGDGNPPTYVGIDVIPCPAGGPCNGVSYVRGTAESGADCNNLTDDDADNLVNDGCGLGTIDTCVEVAVDDTFSVDIFIDDVPTGQDAAGFGGFLNYDNTKLTGTAFEHDTAPPSVSLIFGNTGSSPLDFTQIQQTLGRFSITVSDTAGAGTAEPAGSLGVLGRYTFHADASGYVYLNLTGTPNYKVTDSTGALINYTDLLDSTYDPQYGIIAIGESCPGESDLAITAQNLWDKTLTPDVPPYFECAVGTDPPLEIDVSTQEWLCLEKKVQNLGPDDASVMITKEVDAPDPADTYPNEDPYFRDPATWAGYPTEVSVHVSSVEEIIHIKEGVTYYDKVDTNTDGICDTKQNPQVAPAGGVTLGPGLTVSTCYAVDSEPDVWKEISVEVPMDLTVAAGEVAIEENFDVHCEGPSTHTFTFQNAIGLAGEGTDPTPGNNTAVDTYQVDCMADADLQISDAAVAAPASAVVDVAFDVTVNANVTNGGTWDPVNADVTLDLDLSGAADCGKVPNTPQTHEDLSLGTDVATATWSVTCTSTGNKTFGGEATSIVLDDDPHIEDPNGANNGPVSATTDSTDIVAKSADVHVVEGGWTIAEDDLPNPGNQVLIVPGTPATITTQQIMDNAGPDGPAATDDDRTVADVASVCDVTPNNRSNSFDLEVDDPVGQNDSWSVDWIDDPKPPYSCTLTFDKTLTITDVTFSDPVPGNNTDSVSVEVVLDSDDDGIADDGDLSGDDWDNRCEPGETTLCDDNCEDNANPDQADIDEDGWGDVCDLDNDNDGILDDGDTSGIVGDNPCTGGETVDCDDNCRLTPNPGQEDEESDGIGNVCELDVDCDGDRDITDALMIMHYIVGWAELSPDQCPPPAGFLYGPMASAYVAYPGGGDIGDALMVLHCIVNYHNIVCPADEDG